MSRLDLLSPLTSPQYFSHNLLYRKCPGLPRVIRSRRNRSSTPLNLCQTSQESSIWGRRGEKCWIWSSSSQQLLTIPPILSRKVDLINHIKMFAFCSNYFQWASSQVRLMQTPSGQRPSTKLTIRLGNMTGKTGNPSRSWKRLIQFWPSQPPQDRLIRCLREHQERENVKKITPEKLELINTYINNCIEWKVDVIF